MASLGVEVHVTAGDLPALPAPQQITWVSQLCAAQQSHV